MLDRHELKRLAEFFATDRDRFTMACPDCKQGCNSAGHGGNEKCFHCDNCGLIECLIIGLQINQSIEDRMGE
jgi:hypothetical protein